MWLILVLLAALIGYYFLKRNYSYWKDRGVPGPDPKYVVGNLGEMFLFKKTMGQVYTDIYNAFQGYPFVGIYRAGTPCLLIRDPEFIKNITVKDFKSFMNNDLYVDKNVDLLFGRNPFVLRGEEWKNTRNQITPCFTSGKMKLVYPLVEDVAKRLVKYIKEHVKSPDEPLEAKGLCTKFTLDNVASCAFGIEGNSFVDPNSEFRLIAKAFHEPDTLTAIKFFISMIVPRMTNILSMKLIPREIEAKIINIVEQTLKYREENVVVRNDFINMMNELRKKHTDFTMIDVAAQGATFLLDGFETSAIVMSFALFELACNPDVQSKLRVEIEESIQKNNGTFTFDSIHEMSYLHAVVLESMRKSPTITNLGKVCTEKYTYMPSEDSGYKKISVAVEPGTPIVFPLQALANDEIHFKQPKSFNPDRHLGENSYNRYAFLPFGEGPRTCLGQRFGLMQVKVGVAFIIKDFELSLNKKTKLPLKFDPMYFLASPIGGLWIKFKKIETATLDAKSKFHINFL